MLRISLFVLFILGAALQKCWSTQYDEADRSLDSNTAYREPAVLAPAIPEEEMSIFLPNDPGLETDIQQDVEAENNYK